MVTRDVLKVFQIILAYGSCNFENFQNVIGAHKSRNALAFRRLPVLISHSPCNLIRLHISVPSRAPSNVRAANQGLNELLVEWDPLPHLYANGRLLGYKVYYKDVSNYYSREIAVNTSNPDESHVILVSVQTGHRYKISAVAFTSKGEGPRSPDLYVTKGKWLLNF